MKTVYNILFLSIALALTSCAEENQKVLADSTAAIPVIVSQVNKNTDSPFLAVSGKIQAKHSAELSTRMMGYVNKVAVDVGDSVRKGQLLIAINNADLQAQKAQVTANITKATAAFNNAKKDFERFKALFAQNSASQKEMDDMTANYEMAKAGLEAAKQMRNEINAQFAYTNITAPFNGVVTHKTVKQGDMATPGQPLISMEAPAEFEVLAMVPESEISAITKHMEVKVNVKSIKQTISGKVTEISTSALQTGGQYLVKIELDKTDASILSGMFTTVQFPVERQTESAMVLVPQEALVTNGQLIGVYTVSERNTAILRWLRLGRTYNEKVEVLSGLGAGETFILSSKGKLYNGAKISIE